MRSSLKRLLSLLVFALAAAGSPRAEPAPVYRGALWTTKQGAPAYIRDLVQTPDGYLWITAVSGLYRFDGMRFERVQGQAGEPPTTNAYSLATPPSGDFWISSSSPGGAIVYRDGHTRRVKLPRFWGGRRIVPQPGGAIWAATAKGLYRLDGGQARRLGPRDGAPQGRINDLVIAPDQTVWASAEQTLVRKPPGSQVFQPTGLRFDSDANALSIGRDGRLWLLDPAGGARVVTRLATGRFALGPRLRAPAPGAGQGLAASNFGDQPFGAAQRRDVALAIEHAALGAMTPGGLAARLPSPPFVSPRLLDREGNLWIGTSLGLIRLRPVDFSMFKADFDGAIDSPASADDHKGGAYIGAVLSGPTSGGAPPMRRNRLRLVHVAQAADPGLAPTTTTIEAEFPWLPTRTNFTSLGFQVDRDGALLVGTGGHLWKLEGRRLVRAPLPDPIDGELSSFAIDADGSLWIGALTGRVFHRAAGAWREKTDLPTAFRGTALVVLNDAAGRIWISTGWAPNRVVMVDHGRTRSFDGRDGLDLGRVQDFVATPGGGAILAGDTGVARLEGNRIRSLTAGQMGGLGGVSGVVIAPDRSVWLNTQRGVARIDRQDWERAFASPAVPLTYSLFDSRNGLDGVAADSAVQTAFAAAGRLWFAANQGIGVVEPARLRGNAAFPLKIESVTADGVTHPSAGGSVKLPAGSSNFEIDYTALDLTDAEGVRFFYRMSGVDERWIDAGGRRQAFYTHLAPGVYTFTLRAVNGRGFWAKNDKTLTVDVPPTFLQSLAFKGLAVVLALAVVLLVAVIWVRNLTQRLRNEMAGRLSERERVSRELHDTLMQDFQGLSLQLQAMVLRPPEKDELRSRLGAALDNVDHNLAEARRRIMNLRGEHGDTDLARQLGETPFQRTPEIAPVIVRTRGQARELHPVVCDEVLSIGREAIGNALRHASASHIDVTLTYGRARFSLEVKDDGVGMAPELFTHGRDGHFGLAGMRERARQVGADLNLASAPGAGVKLLLKVPGRVAYRGRKWLGWLIPSPPHPAHALDSIGR